MSTREIKLEEIYALVGRTYRACLLFEYKLADVVYEWRIHSCPKRPRELIEGIKEINEIRKDVFDHTVLGPNIEKLRKAGALTEDSIELLKKFKGQRNEFIHDFYSEYGVELMLIERNFENGIFNENVVEEAYCKLKTVLDQTIYNMKMAGDWCNKMADLIQKQC